MNGDAPAAQLRLSPDMVSLRLQVLKFARAYISLWGQGPSYGEIAEATGTNRTRVKRTVRQLTREGLLLRVAGHRGLMLPDQQTEALRVLRDLGWGIDSESARLTPPANDRAVTKRTLRAIRVLDYDGGRLAAGGDSDDGAQEIPADGKSAGRNHG